MKSSVWTVRENLGIGKLENRKDTVWGRALAPSQVARVRGVRERLRTAFTAARAGYNTKKSLLFLTDRFLKDPAYLFSESLES